MALRVLLVFLGSGFGGVLRFLLGTWAARQLGTGFPYGTITINLLGSFFISVIMYLGLNTDLIGPDLRLALTTGIMGGFTTYSTFNYESIALLQQGAFTLGAANILATVVLCLVAGGGGIGPGDKRCAPAPRCESAAR